MALLGEMTITSGKVLLHKDPAQVENGLIQTVSYAAQNPWLRKEPIRENILFGQPYEEERYDAVIEACALKPDLDLLPDGDSTRWADLKNYRVGLALNMIQGPYLCLEVKKVELHSRELYTPARSMFCWTMFSVLLCVFMVLCTQSFLSL